MTATNRRKFLAGLAAAASAPFVVPGAVERYLVSKLGVPPSADRRGSVTICPNEGVLSHYGADGVLRVSRAGEPGTHVRPGEFYTIKQGDELAWLLNNPGMALAR